MIEFNHEYFMRIALQQAEIAASEGEVPVGAVGVCNNVILAKAYNQVEKLKDPTAHAEIILLTQIANALNDWRFTEVSIYITKEPCPMCMGAMLNARVKRIIFGLSDLRLGAAGGRIDLCEMDFPRPEIVSGVLQDESLKIMQEFFQKLRSSKRNN